ncbi:response regulator [Segetibacter sp. 3557_3]|uniref:response regulator n=1 Tax=Segetibacter sp. 3557_3 TaxID=2547429 RepID=UPI001FB779AD|nr:response regulator [Segetibacter sp. 3557_3]
MPFYKAVDDVHYVHKAMQAFVYLEEVLQASELLKMIITDLYFPGITGAEFLKDLKDLDKYKNIPVVVLSTEKTELEIIKYKELGAIDYLTKPSKYAEYLEVAKHLTRKANIR